MLKTIYTQTNPDATIIFDENDPDLPVGIRNRNDADGEVWLTPEAASAIARYAAEVEPEAPEGVRASKVSFTEGLLRLAAIHSKTVNFGYRSLEGEPVVPREVVVDKITRSVAGNLLMYGYDTDAEDVRCFRLDRINDAVLVD